MIELITNGVIQPRLLIVGLVIVGLALALRRTELDRGARLRTWLAVSLPLLLWLGVVWVAAEAGLFVPRRGVPAFRWRCCCRCWSACRCCCARQTWPPCYAVEPGWLVGFQVFRVLGAVFLVRWASGTLPGAFALPAGIGDAGRGPGAARGAVAALRRARRIYRCGMVARVPGITDLALALTLGFLSSPTPFQRIAFDHPNTTIGTYPLVMIPAFAVPLSILLHALSLRQLARRRRSGDRVARPRPSAAPRTLEQSQGA
jgi:hypothetical protein